MKRFSGLAAAAALALSFTPALAENVLRVGDQRGGSRALMEAAGVLSDVPYKIEWSEFPAAAPLLEALNAEAIDTGIVGDAPFTFAVASGAPIRAIMAVQQDQGGLAILVRANSPMKSLADLKGKRIGTGRGSVGHQLVLAALEDEKIPKGEINLSFLLPAEAKAALTEWLARCMVDLGALHVAAGPFRRSAHRAGRTRHHPRPWVPGREYGSHRNQARRA